MGVIAIVGHGPSLRGAGKGEYIDSFDYVVRFPYSGNWQIPGDYGTKTTFFCATVRRSHKIAERQRPDSGYFIWSKYGGSIPERLKDLIAECGGEDVTNIVNYWQQKMSTHHYFASLEVNEKTVKHFSHGTAAICIMAHKIKEPITVFGCDSLKEGRISGSAYSGSWVPENRSQKQNNHVLDAELLIVDNVRKYYNVEITFV